MIKVFFIRHAESTWNAWGDKSKNSHITDKGKQQSSEVKGNFDLVICSNLTRAKETLEYSNLNYKEVIYSDLCMEIKNGSPCDYFQDEHVKIEGDKVNDRILELKNFIVEQSKIHKTIGIISHHCFVKKITGVGLRNCQIIPYTFI